MNVKTSSPSLRVPTGTAFLAVLLGAVLSRWPAAGGDDGDWDLTTNAPNMFSLNAGNVGIGTANPE